MAEEVKGDGEKLAEGAPVTEQQAAIPKPSELNPGKSFPATSFWNTGIKLLLAAGVVFAIATAHLWGRAWWHSFRDALFPAEGQIIVGSPAVYTRQRLVNDRLAQTSWLQEQLKITETKDREFRGIDEIRITARSADTSLKVLVGSKDAAGTGSQTDQLRQGQEAKPESTRVEIPPIIPTTADLFRMKNTYREEVRSEIMETQLDDRHDIKGNTIYRLAFDATVLPGTRLNALALIKLTLSHKPESLVYDYKELYYDWMRRMQLAVSGSIDGIATQLNGRFPELRIRLTLTEFVLRRLCERFLPEADLAAEFAAEKDHKPRKCDPYRAPSPQLTEMTRARKMLDDFSATYRTFRIRLYKSNAEHTIRTATGGKNIDIKGMEMSVARLQQACSATPSGFVDIDIVGTKTNVQCPPTDRPHEGLNGAVVLYEQLHNASRANIEQQFKTINAAFDSKDCKEQCGELSPAEYRCFATEYMQATLETFGHATEMDRQPISTFFATRIIGRDVGNCNLLFTPEWSSDTPQALARELNKGVELYAYSVTPKNLVQHVATASDTRDAVQALISANFTAAGQQASTLAEDLRKRSSQSQRVQSNPIIVGFGVGNQSYSPIKDPSKKEWTTQFGWAIAPQFEGENGSERRQGERQYSLAALISVPAWWRSIDVKVETCWVDQKDLNVTRDELCPGRAAKNKEQTDTVRLPGAINELSHKLGFDVVQEPRLDRNSDPTTPLQIETGRPASILLTGGRIWRSTEVTLGSQKADEIVVLPNMEGILAKFKCVRRQLPIRLPPPPKDKTDMGPPENFIRVPVDIKVWTSEGVTEPAFAELITPKPAAGAPGSATKPEPDNTTMCQDELRDLGRDTAPPPSIQQPTMNQAEKTANKQ
jgi:hypothetical protein